MIKRHPLVIFTLLAFGLTSLYGSPVWLHVLDICAKSILFTWVFVRTRKAC